jgi:hypothetical protein
MDATVDFEGRRAPYAPISALERFFERIRDRTVPDHIDHRFLQRLNVASNNEYALLSALKFLDIVDERGRPTHAYRQLQRTDQFRQTLRHLVETAYRPVFESGADGWEWDDLVNFFRVSSSPSQAKNAARFFRAVSQLAEMHNPPAVRAAVEPEASEPTPRNAAAGADTVKSEKQTSVHELVLMAKAKLLEKLPAPDPMWSAEDYRQICDRFVEMLRSLDG